MPVLADSPDGYIQREHRKPTVINQIDGPAVVTLHFPVEARSQQCIDNNGVAQSMPVLIQLL
jgi:hypothetical protein